MKLEGEVKPNSARAAVIVEMIPAKGRGGDPAGQGELYPDGDLTLWAGGQETCLVNLPLVGAGIPKVETFGDAHELGIVNEVAGEVLIVQGSEVCAGARGAINEEGSHRDNIRLKSTRKITWYRIIPLYRINYAMIIYFKCSSPCVCFISGTRPPRICPFGCSWL